MLFNNLAKSRKGQMRILESVVAAMIVIILFSVSMFLVSTSNVRVLQEREDLDRIGYNVLNRLVESRTIDEILQIPTQREVYLKTTIQEALANTIYFNLTIYSCLDKGSYISLQPLISVTNTLDGSLSNSLEVSSTNVIYTSENGSIYNVLLVLARAGGS
jgi:hypothetical protein